MCWVLFFCEIDFESNLILFLCVYVQKKAPREMEYLRTTEDTMNYALAQSRICNYGQYMRIKTLRAIPTLRIRREQVPVCHE